MDSKFSSEGFFRNSSREIFLSVYNSENTYRGAVSYDAGSVSVVTKRHNEEDSEGCFDKCWDKYFNLNE